MLSSCSAIRGVRVFCIVESSILTAGWPAARPWILARQSNGIACAEKEKPYQGGCAILISGLALEVTPLLCVKVWVASGTAGLISLDFQCSLDPFQALSQFACLDDSRLLCEQRHHFAGCRGADLAGKRGGGDRFSTLVQGFPI